MKSRSKSLHINIFDLDGTLLTGNASFAFSRYLFQTRSFSFRQFLYVLWLTLLYKFGLLKQRSLHTKAFRALFQGKKAETFLQAAKAFSPTLLSKLYAPCRSRISKNSFLLSSSPDFLVQPIASALQLPFRATQWSIDKEGRFCHIALLMDGEEKARVVQSLFPTYIKTVFTDSKDDLPLILVADACVAVRADRSVCKLAKERL